MTAKTNLSADSYPQLDALETSSHHQRKSSYRDFLVSSCRTDIDWNRLIYGTVDSIEKTEKASKYDSCRDYAWFLRHRDTGEIRVASACCKLRWCPLCMRSKRFVITQEVVKWLKNVRRPKFLTFTLRHNDDSLADRLNDLYKFFRNVRRTKWFKRNVKGGVWFFQVTKNPETGRWHPHIHCLVDSNFLPKEKLSELWELITGDSKIVDVRSVKDHKKTAEYVARYASAPCRLLNFSVDDSIEIMQTLHGRRICGTWGTGSDMSFKLTPPDDADRWDRIGNWSVIWHDKANPHWCRIIRLAWIHGQPLQWRPPPDLCGDVPWDMTDKIVAEKYAVTQLQFHFMEN